MANRLLASTWVRPAQHLDCVLLPETANWDGILCVLGAAYCAAVLLLVSLHNTSRLGGC
jgi:hypothetical protein